MSHMYVESSGSASQTSGTMIVWCNATNSLLWDSLPISRGRQVWGDAFWDIGFFCARRNWTKGKMLQVYKHNALRSKICGFYCSKYFINENIVINITVKIHFNHIQSQPTPKFLSAGMMTKQWASHILHQLVKRRHQAIKKKQQSF